MIQDIFVGVLCVIVFAVGVFGFWLDNGNSFKKKGSDESNEQKSYIIHI